jgi:hypothetical protein
MVVFTWQKYLITTMIIGRKEEFLIMHINVDRIKTKRITVAKGNPDIAYLAMLAGTYTTQYY